HVYLAEKALYKGDDDKDSFRWIDASNYDQSVFSYYRIKDGELIVVVLNLTPNSYMDYRLGVPMAGTYDEIINSDKDVYGGSNLYNGLPVKSEEIFSHSFMNSINIVLSPLSVTILKRRQE
nr:alpha amylase C-terminal domain-containing protein [Gammaproteobacteria bacterium]